MLLWFQKHFVHQEVFLAVGIVATIPLWNQVKTVWILQLYATLGLRDAEANALGIFKNVIQTSSVDPAETYAETFVSIHPTKNAQQVS